MPLNIREWLNMSFSIYAQTRVGTVKVHAKYLKEIDFQYRPMGLKKV